MNVLRIDRMLFLMAFERDVDYEDPPQEAYLDLVSGSIEWLFEEDENAELLGINAAENKTQRNRVDGDPDRFLLIPGLSHDDQEHRAPPQFPANREFYREFCKIVASGAPETLNSGAVAGRLREIPYSTEQGIISVEQGKLAREQRILLATTKAIAG